MLPFKGVLVRRTRDLTSVSPSLHVPWQAATYDTGGFWDAGSPTRLTIPDGITKVRLMGAVALQASLTAGGVFLSVEKNGSGDIPGSAAATFRQVSTVYTSNAFATFTAVLPVTAGDWFRLRVNFSSPSWNAILANGRSFATMRFAAGADTATFIAATETVLEPGDVLSVVAPPTPDVTLADVGFSLAGTLEG